MSFRAILVPHDFSAAANLAAVIARDEARAHHATIVLLHVIEVPTSLLPEAAVLYDENGAPLSASQYVFEAAEARLGAIARRLEQDGADTEIRVRAGYPEDEIARYVEDNPIDLIVMGTHGRRGFQKVLMGSTTERVLRTVSVPVLTVPPPPEGAPQPRSRLLEALQEA